MLSEMKENYVISVGSQLILNVKRKLIWFFFFAIIVLKIYLLERIFDRQKSFLVDCIGWFENDWKRDKVREKEWMKKLK